MENKTAYEEIQNIVVGVPHVRSRINDIINSSYNLNSAIFDIMDNVNKGYDIYIDIQNNDDGYIFLIIIRDNDPEGFKDIIKHGIENPLNMGHENRDRHNNDDSNSEFGLGLKNASIFLSNKLIIYTRTKDGYFKAILDFEAMSNNPSAVDSYNPVIKKISMEEYKNNHNQMDYGSTIKLSNLRHKTLKQDIHFKDFEEKIKDTYKYQIRNNGKVIKINNKDRGKYETLDNIQYLSNSELYNNRKIIIEVYFDNEGSNCYAVYGKDKYILGNETKTGKRNIIKAKEYIQEQPNKVIIEISSIYGTSFDSHTNSKTRELIPNSEPYNEKHNLYTEYLPKNICNIFRDNRCHGAIDFNLSQSDGYQNFTINEIHYKSKKYNKFFGVNSSKGNLIKREEYDNIKFIEKILKKFNKEFSTKTLTIQEEQIEEEPIQEEPIQEEPIQEEPIQEYTIQEVTIQEEPKQEETIQEEPKQEKPKQEETIQEEPIQEVTIQEETKQKEGKEILVKPYAKGFISEEKRIKIIKYIQENDVSNDKNLLAFCNSHNIF